MKKHTRTNISKNQNRGSTVNLLSRSAEQQDSEQTQPDNQTNFSKNNNYTPIIMEFPDTIRTDILKEQEDPQFSINIDYPRFAYGFQHYIHANKNKMEILQQFENKKKVYRVMNQFESRIDNYNESISDMAKPYFDIKDDRPDILSRGFYKLWEILFMFNLIDVEQDKFVSTHLAEGPGSFIQATMFFRDKFSKKSKNDKYYAVTLHSEDIDKYVPEMENKFVDYYDKENPKRFILHKTYPKNISRSSKNKDNGDLNDPKTIKLFGGQMKEKADFITADGGFNWENENTQEQEAFKLIFSQILAALKSQKKGGHFVCKFFETYTKTSVKFISILKQFYNKLHFTKPLLSRSSNSEKYLICMDFKYNDKDTEYKMMITKLDNIHEMSHKNVNLNLVDIFPEYEPGLDLLKYIIYINLEIANNQFKNINEIVEFINSQNYYGDIYQMRRDMQIIANKYWINRFFPSKDTFKDKINSIRKDTVDIIENTSKSVNKEMTRVISSF